MHSRVTLRHLPCFSRVFKLRKQVPQKSPQDLPPVILFMSDGGCALADGEPKLQKIVSAFPGVIVDTLAFGTGADTKKLQALTDIAGGKMKFADTSTSLHHKFAEVASGLSQRPRHSGNEAQLAKESSMSRACVAVVDDVVPIVVSL